MAAHYQHCGGHRSEARAADMIFDHGLVIEYALVRKWLRQTPIVAYVHGDLAWEAGRQGGEITDDFETFQRRR